jgi:hypothetical protein
MWSGVYRKNRNIFELCDTNMLMEAYVVFLYPSLVHPLTPSSWHHVLKEHKPRRPIPVGYKTPQCPDRASTIEEATTRGNLQFHDDIYINQLRRTPEEPSKYAIPGFHDQLTNAVYARHSSYARKTLMRGNVAKYFNLGLKRAKRRRETHVIVLQALARCRCRLLWMNTDVCLGRRS